MYWNRLFIFESPKKLKRNFSESKYLEESDKMLKTLNEKLAGYSLLVITN